MPIDPRATKMLADSATERPRARRAVMAPFAEHEAHAVVAELRRDLPEPGRVVTPRMAFDYAAPDAATILRERIENGRVRDQQYLYDAVAAVVEVFSKIEGQVLTDVWIRERAATAVQVLHCEGYIPLDEVAS